MHRRLPIFLILFVFSMISAFSQTTIWSVDFETGYSDNDQTAQDNNAPTGADWTKTGTPSTWWRVESDGPITGLRSMSGRNTDGVMTWTSETIDISGYNNVTISMDINEQACEAGDIIETFYDIGAGNVEFGDGNGDGDFNSATNTVSGLSASTLVITVTLNNNGNGERLRFDNILVTGELLGPDGPGGVGLTDGTGFLELWVKADAEVYNDAGTTLASNNDDVEEWHDQSGNNNDLSEGTNQPVYQTNQANGLPAVDFNGSNDQLLATGISTSNNATILTVVRVEALTNNNDGIIHAAPSGSSFSTSGGNKSIGMWVETATGEPWGRGVESDGTVRSIPSVTVISTGTFYEISNQYDGSDITQYINGATAGSISYDGTLQSWTDFGVGRQGNETFDGDIAEVIAFTGALNDAQLIIVQNYLCAKYGITDMTNNIYDEDSSLYGDYDFEVAGIGMAANGSSHEDAKGTGIVQINSPSNLGVSEFLIWGHDNGALSSFGVSDLPSGVQSRLARTWRASETGEVGTITISFDLTDVGGSQTASDLRLLIDSDNDGLFNDESGGSVISGATNTSGNIFEWTGVDIDDNQRFTIGSIDLAQTPLPVTLTDFDAGFINNKVDLFWRTENEINSSYFVIERSRDLKNWQDVKRIEAAGFSSESITYEIEDRQPFKGTSYYRLLQFDIDGQSEIYGPVSVKVLNSNEEIKVYPVPVHNQLLVDLNDTAIDAFQIIQSTGHVVLSNSTRGNTDGILEIDVSELEAGMYLLILQSAENQIVKKFIKE